MNIPVDNSNHHVDAMPASTSSLNIEIEDQVQQHQQVDDESDLTEYVHRRFHPARNEHDDQHEQLEVFVGFYRPGEYQRENIDEDDDTVDDSSSEHTEPLASQTKGMQVSLVSIAKLDVFHCPFMLMFSRHAC
jgi:hypothetical protein